ncbi:hypothetical protein A3K93_04330 [Acinetobacter sp. NCu2D-2]|uniref:Ig-like domain-containing protein n=1 Tax=Acinetobacter sp. NCu2D-2 TaxID=1608473 RepID=UPI0007CE0CA0|nr:Ig-like domain-containing protein [Acinetobacter sp. NCu2D-2]ANF81491.1 hypothetical protein A3K93_04330 [Acinetobacter sp. NCu2D-2]
MTKIVVYSKDHLIPLQNTQNNQIVLNKNSLVLIHHPKESIASIERSGTSAIIHLKNGETIVLENFFNLEGTPENQIVLSNPQGYYDVMLLDEQGQLIQYNPVNNINVLANSPNWISSTQVNAIQAAADESTPWYSSNIIKGGLALVAAEALYLTAFKKDDDKDNTPKDTIAPATPKGTLDEAGKVITGQTEANAKIYVIDANYNVLAEVQADASGNYKLSLSRDIVNNEKVYVYAKDAAGNSSSLLALTGTKDTLAPEVESAQFSEDGAFVTGKTEAKAKVYVYAEDGVTVLAGPITAAADGTFTLNLNPPLSSNDKAKVIAVDEAGNKSTAYEVIVGQDTISPAQPLIEVSTDGTLIKGKGEVGTTVQILDANQNVIAEQVIGSDGTFNITLNPAMTDTSKYSLMLKDSAGNQSKAVELKLGLDTLAPEEVQATLSDDGKKLTGTAEANSTIEVKSGTTVMGTGQADASGKFEITLTTALLNNNKATVIAYDAAKNASPSLEITGTKDTVAPNKVVLRTVTDDIGDSKGSITSDSTTDDSQPKFEGTGEAGATITIYNHGIPIGTTVVTSNSTWSFTPIKPLELGEQSISFTQMDAAKNTSDMSDAFKFTVVAQVSVSESEENIDVESLLSEDNGANSNMRCDSFKSLMIINKLSKFL